MWLIALRCFDLLLSPLLHPIWLVAASVAQVTGFARGGIPRLMRVTAIAGSLIAPGMAFMACATAMALARDHTCRKPFVVWLAGLATGLVLWYPTIWAAVLLINAIGGGASAAASE